MGLLDVLTDAYMRNVGNPARQLVGGGVRGLLGFDPPEYADSLGMEAYRNAAAMGNAPGINAPVGAFKAAAKVVPEAAMFIGALAKTWDKASNAKAVQMEKAGKDAREIWRETGNLKGPDGKWRQEISDAQALIDHPMPNVVALREQARTAKSLDEAKQITSEYNQWMDTVRGSPAVTSMSVTTRPDISGFKHADLLDAYPEKLPRIWWENIGAAKGGSYDPAANKVSIGMGSYADLAESKSTALHELQHAVQEREGFARGGSPGAGERAPFVFGAGPVAKRMKQIEQQFMQTQYPSKQYDDLIKEYETLKSKEDAEAAFEGYRRLAGEAEARATQARMNMTPAERRATFPYDSYDVPVDQLIVRGLLAP